MSLIGYDGQIELDDDDWDEEDDPYRNGYDDDEDCICLDCNCHFLRGLCLECGGYHSAT